MNENDICYGCPLLAFKDCVMRKKDMQNKCPCIECLLKSTCTLVCNEWTQLRIKVMNLK